MTHRFESGFSLCFSNKIFFLCVFVAKFPSVCEEETAVCSAHGALSQHPKRCANREKDEL